MEESFNPYQAPSEVSSLERGESTRGPWRDGDILVMRKTDVLPPNCVACNTPTDIWLKRNLFWHSPLWYILVISPLIYIVAAMIVRQTAKIHVGICPRHRSRRRWAILIGWGGFFLGIVIMIMSAAVRSDQARTAILLLGVAVMVGSILYGIVRSQIVTPQRIDRDHVRLKGISTGMLDELPDWTGA